MVFIFADEIVNVKWILFLPGNSVKDIVIAFLFFSPSSSMLKSMTELFSWGSEKDTLSSDLNDAFTTGEAAPELFFNVISISFLSPNAIYSGCFSSPITDVDLDSNRTVVVPVSVESGALLSYVEGPNSSRHSEHIRLSHLAQIDLSSFW